MTGRRVVITGLGVITPLGVDVNTFWQRELAGCSGIGPITQFDILNSGRPYDVRFGGECRDFNPEQYIDRKQVKRIDRFAQFAIAAATQAAKDSGLDFSRENVDRVGVIIGSGIGGLTELEEQHRRMLDKGPEKISVFTIPKLMVNAASGNVSILFGAQGPSTAVATACASAANAMADAFKAIARDEADVMFTGGSEAALTPLGVAAFAAMKALSTRNDDPQRASRPFDKDRDGFVMGEGAGIVIMEELEHARRRGATIYAEIVGYGVSSDAFHITQPQTEGTGAGKAMRMALADAKLNPSDIDYINAHGTSTPLGDIAETKAMKAVFGPSAYKVAISSTKSSIGHLLGASGGVEIVASILALRDQVAPPTINLETPDPECDLDYVPNKPRPMKIECAMSNSFGFGGHNASLVIRKYR
jgi:3-oxoacyl-[acyl-carrier-protein] synthase II